MDSAGDCRQRKQEDFHETKQKNVAGIRGAAAARGNLWCAVDCHFAGGAVWCAAELLLSSGRAGDLFPLLRKRPENRYYQRKRPGVFCGDWPRNHYARALCHPLRQRNGGGPRGNHYRPGGENQTSAAALRHSGSRRFGAKG